MTKIVRMLVWLIKADVSGQLDQPSLYTQQQVAWTLSTQPTNVSETGRQYPKNMRRNCGSRQMTISKPERVGTF